MLGKSGEGGRGQRSTAECYQITAVVTVKVKPTQDPGEEDPPAV